MGRKLFEADDAVEQLLSRYAKEHGVKIGSKINQSVYNAFLPQEAATISCGGKLYFTGAYGGATTRRYDKQIFVDGEYHG